MAAKPRKMDGDDLILPHEIWTEILTRLSVKTILRCRSVCKSWYSLVSCPNFISRYPIRNLNKNGYRVLLQLRDDRNRNPVYSFSSHDESFLEQHCDFPEPFRVQDLKVVGSCNGLICLHKHDLGCGSRTVTFLIWNPTIRKIVEVPPRTFSSDPQSPSYIGFGFDSQTSDYKVLWTGKNGDVSDANVCEIYDLRKGVWRRISTVVPYLNVGLEWDHNQECYLNGVVHWTGYTYRHRHANNYVKILLSFDMSSECFQEIRMPDSAEFADADYVQTRSMTFGGLIHVLVWKKGWEGYVNVFESCSVWVMREYGVTESWAKLFSIDLRRSQSIPCIDPKWFRLWKNGEVLIVYDRKIIVQGVEEDDYVAFVDHQEMILYDGESRKCKHLVSFPESLLGMCLYEESLVLM